MNNEVEGFERLRPWLNRVVIPVFFSRRIVKNQEKTWAKIAVVPNIPTCYALHNMWIQKPCLPSYQQFKLAELIACMITSQVTHASSTTQQHVYVEPKRIQRTGTWHDVNIPTPVNILLLSPKHLHNLLFSTELCYLSVLCFPKHMLIYVYNVCFA
jgi:hypothetical protein